MSRTTWYIVEDQVDLETFLHQYTYLFCRNVEFALNVTTYESRFSDVGYAENNNFKITENTIKSAEIQQQKIFDGKQTIDNNACVLIITIF